VFIECQLPGQYSPSGLSHDDLFQAVSDLRGNEQGWNRALQAALIEADDLHKAGSGTQAADSLLKFSTQCPWRLFKQVAEDQATCYC
jgi:hypothetical protein